MRAAYCTQRCDLEVIAVKKVGPNIGAAVDWLDQQQLLMPYEYDDAGKQALEFRNGDCLLLLDLDWTNRDNDRSIILHAREANIPVYTIIWDVPSVTLTEGNVADGCERWSYCSLHKALEESDGIICTTQSDANELVRFAKCSGITRPGFRVGLWDIGLTPATVVEDSKLSPSSDLAWIQAESDYDTNTFSEFTWGKSTDALFAIVVDGKWNWCA